MEVFLRVSFHWDFLQLVNGFVVIGFNVRPIFGNLVPNANPLHQLGNIFLSLVRTRSSTSFPSVPKKSSTKRLMVPATVWGRLFFSNAFPF